MECIRDRQGHPHAGTTGYFGQRCLIQELEFVAVGNHTKMVLRRILNGDTVPCAVPLLLPCIERLAVDLVDRGFGDGHRARITLKKEIHVIHLAVGTRQIHAREMAAWPQVRQVFNMYADQLEPEDLISEWELEISSA